MTKSKRTLKDLDNHTYYLHVEELVSWNVDQELFLVISVDESDICLDKILLAELISELQAIHDEL